MTASSEAPKKSSVISIFRYDSELCDKQYQAASQSASPAFGNVANWALGEFLPSGKIRRGLRLRSELKETLYNLANKLSIRFNFSNQYCLTSRLQQFIQ